jgi:hypothetical protein
MHYLRKLDKLVIALTCIGIIISFYMIFRPADHKILIVYSDKEKYEYPLEDGEINIKNSHGSVHVIIHKGRVKAVESTCLDKWCTNMGAINSVGDSIVCLPAHIFLSIQQENVDAENEFDTVTR